MLSDSFFGTGNFSKTISFYGTAVNAFNNGDAEMIIVAGENNEFRLYPGVELNAEELSPFTTVEITATGPWECIIRGRPAYDTGTSDLISEIRILIHDVDKLEYPTDEDLLPHINQAITFLSKQLIAAGSLIMVQEDIFTDDMPVPLLFEKTCGEYPLRVLGGKVKMRSPGDMTVQYYAHKPRIKAVTDSVDFPAQYVSALAYVAAMFAQNKNEFEIQQDEGLLAKLL